MKLRKTLTAMKSDITSAASLLPSSLRFGCIGYCCTSASAQIGSDKVSDLVKAGARVEHVSDPLIAVLAALSSLNARRVAIVTPYIPAVSAAIVDAVRQYGIHIHCVESFNEVVDSNVARINPQSILNAVLKVGRDPNVDAVFVSCTNLRTVDIILQAERELGLPVVSSNTALAWHMSILAGLNTLPPMCGMLSTLTNKHPAAAAPTELTVDKYCSMFLQKQSLPRTVRARGVVGRFLRVVGDHQFTMLSDDPSKKLAWVCSEEMISAVLGMNAVEALLYVGKSLNWLEKRLHDGTRHSLVVFPVSEGTVATWDNVFDLVHAHYGDEVALKLSPFRATVSAMRDYSSFPDEGALVVGIHDLQLKDKLAHPGFMSVERLLQMEDTVMDPFKARAFFHHSMGCNELFIGTGKNASGDTEILVPNVALDSISGLKHIPLFYNLVDLQKLKEMKNCNDVTFQ